MVQISATLIAVVLFVVIIAVVLLVFVFFIRESQLRGATGETGGVGCLAPPIPPTNVTLENPIADIISVNWDPAPGAATYRVYLDRNPGFLIRDAQEVRSTDETSLSFGDLDTGFIYYIKVTSFSVCGEGDPSIEASIIIPFNWPNRFQIINFDDATIDFTQDPTSVIFPYRVFATDTGCAPSNCWYNYNEIDKTIRLQIDDTRCVTAIGSQVWVNQCLLSPLINRQWEYNAAL